MCELRKEEMRKINGGASVSISSVLNAVMNVVSTIFSIGQAVGSAIRRGVSGKVCSP